MTPKKDDHFETPFIHANIELKKVLLDHARQLASQDGMEAPIAAAVIYASFAEYLTEFLLENVRLMCSEASLRSFDGVIYSKKKPEQTKKEKTFGEIIGLLRRYKFPGDDEILARCKKISDARNNLFHNFAKVSQEDLQGLDNDIAIIRPATEELIGLVDIVNQEMTRQYYKMLSAKAAEATVSAESDKASDDTEK